MVKLPKQTNKKNSITGVIYDGLVVANEKSRRPRSDAKPIVRVSSVGDCVRKNWARMNDVAMDEGRGLTGRTYSIFQLGDKIEELVLDHLRGAGFTVTDEQASVRFETGEGLLVGHIDGVIRIGGERMLLEVKSANDNNFNRCEEMGYEVWQPKYASQIHCYMAGLGLNNCVVVVYNKNTSEIYVEQIRFDVGCYRRARADTELILRDNKGKPPERPVEARNQSCPLCKWCDFKGWCWGPTSSVVWED